jgi:tetratricopeptide (TPR) repeat protein
MGGQCAQSSEHAAVNMLAFTLAETGEAQEAERFLRAQIEKNPENLAPRRALATVLLRSGNGTEAVRVARECAQAPGANSSDWNQYGWYALVAGQVDAAAIEAVAKAQSQSIPAVQHTIASMYASTGKLQEARQPAMQLLDSMVEIPDEWWYVMGRIAEGAGAPRSALDYYKRVQPNLLEESGPDSTFTLAQKRLPAVSGKFWVLHTSEQAGNRDCEPMRALCRLFCIEGLQNSPMTLPNPDKPEPNRATDKYRGKPLPGGRGSVRFHESSGRF